MKPDPDKVAKGDAGGKKTGTFEDHSGEGTLFDAKDVASVVVDTPCVNGVLAEIPKTLTAKHVTFVHHTTVRVEVRLNSLRHDGTKHGHLSFNVDMSTEIHAKMCLEGPGTEAKCCTTSGNPAPSLGHHDVHHNKVSKVKKST